MKDWQANPNLLQYKRCSKYHTATLALFQELHVPNPFKPLTIAFLSEINH